MQTTTEYRQNALDCRALAARARDADERKTLLKMADTWDAIANQRVAVMPPASPGKKPPA